MVAHFRLIAAFACVAFAAPQAPDVYDLEAADVARLEQLLVTNPEDEGARGLLLAYHRRADREGLPGDRAEVVRHALWLVEHHPESGILRSLYFQRGRLTEAELQRAAALWAAAPKTAAVQSNAAQFFAGLDDGLNLHYLEATVVADPNHAGAIRALAFIYARALLEPGKFTDRARAALEGSQNRWVLGNSAYTLQSLYNEKLQRGETDTRAAQLAERYFLRAKALDPSLDRNAILPQVDLAAIARRPAPETEWKTPEIRRLAVDAFPQLPAAVAGVLRAGGCAIPQPYGDGPARNVVRGQFFRNGESGWVVFCLVGETSTLLAFRNDRDTQPDVVFSQEDSGYSHALSSVDGPEFLRRYRMMGGPVPPGILDHQGIDDGFLEKASSRWYFHEGKWTQYPGAD